MISLKWGRINSLAKAVLFSISDNRMDAALGHLFPVEFFFFWVFRVGSVGSRMRRARRHRRHRLSCSSWRRQAATGSGPLLESCPMQRKLCSIFQERNIIFHRIRNQSRVSAPHSAPSTPSATAFNSANFKCSPPPPLTATVTATTAASNKFQATLDLDKIHSYSYWPLQFNIA